VHACQQQFLGGKQLPRQVVLAKDVQSHMVIVVFSLLALSLDHSSVVECQMETQNS
jgi:hypothetical protein